MSKVSLDNVVTPEPGCSTAHPFNVTYRVGRIEKYLSGRWLDLGCADGGYAAQLLEHGVDQLFGVDLDETRIRAANARGIARASFQTFTGDALPFPDAHFGGVFMNEVFEHVADETRTLREIRRVLSPGGRLILISPNRWFPFEGHGMTIGSRRFDSPVPLLPWLPEKYTRRVMRARNYWPRKLIGKVRDAGLLIEETGFIWPVFELYPWLPNKVRERYLLSIGRLDRMPGIRRFGLSTLVVGRRAD
jgi:SAM-dependent methyltransferase